MWRQVIARAKIESPDPTVSVGTGGLLFNSAAVDEVGKENEYVCVFLDTDMRNRLGFCFTKSQFHGAYHFKQPASGKSRRIGCGKFLKQNGMLEKIEQLKIAHFPLKKCDENIRGFEGSDVFVIELQQRR